MSVIFGTYTALAALNHLLHLCGFKVLCYLQNGKLEWLFYKVDTFLQKNFEIMFAALYFYLYDLKERVSDF